MFRLQQLLSGCIIVYAKTILTSDVHGDSDTRLVHQIKTNEDLLNVPSHVKQLILQCTYGESWILPDTFPENPELVQIDNSGISSELNVNLGGNSVERAHLRGLYQCCNKEQETTSTGWKRRRPQPRCCPCCPWYEQFLCHDPSKINTEHSNCNKSVFVFTESIPSADQIKLHIVPGEPVLIPCAAATQFDRPNITFNLHPDGAFNFASFPLKYQNNSYDPRVGLCISSENLVRSMPYVACHYRHLRQPRLLQLIWPPPVPTISPRAIIRLSSPRLHNDSNPERNLIDSPSLLRIVNGYTPTLQCIGLYDQGPIVRRPPSRLCFRWISGNDTEETHMVECSDIQRTTGTSPKVFASAFKQFSPVHKNQTIGCEVSTPSRKAPPTRRQIHLYPRDNWSPAFQWWITDLANSILLKSKLMANESLMVVAAKDTTPITVKIHFWAVNEADENPRCGMAPVGGKFIHNGKLSTQREGWQCQWTISNNTKDLVSIGFGFGRHSHTLHIATSESSLIKIAPESFPLGQKNTSLSCQIDRSLHQFFPTEFDYYWSIKQKNQQFEMKHIKFIDFKTVLDHVDKVFAVYIVPNNGTRSYGIPPVRPSQDSSQFCLSCGLKQDTKIILQSKPICENPAKLPNMFSEYLRKLNKDDNFRAFVEQTGMGLVPMDEQIVTLITNLPITITCVWINDTVASTDGWPTIRLLSPEVFPNQTTLFQVGTRLGVQLTLKQNKDTELKFICKAWQQTSIKSIRLRDGVLPKVSIERRYNLTTSKSTTVLLTCNARGYPTPNITWQRVDSNTSIIKCYSMIQANGEVSCQQEFTINQNENSASIKCQAYNVLGSDSKLFIIEPHSSNLHHVLLRRARDPMILSMIGLLLALTLVLISLCIWRMHVKGKGKRQRLIQTKNILYTKPLLTRYSIDHYISEEQGHVLQAVVELLGGSLEEARRWIIPRHLVHQSVIVLGSGHYGKVTKGWLNYDRSRNQTRHMTEKAIPVALKSSSGESSGLCCLRNEMSILTLVADGPNIVKMEGIILGTHPSLSDAVLLLEFCPNRSLSEFIRKHGDKLTELDNRSRNTSVHSRDSGIGSLKENEIQTNQNEKNYELTVSELYRISLAISNGVAYLARNNIVHRDLATRNILLDADYEPKICDFGLAVRLDQQNGSYQTVSYQKKLPFRILPPEALTEQVFYLASDIWQLAITLWQMFTLEHEKPFSNVNDARELQRIFMVCSQENSTIRKLFKWPCLVDENLWTLMCQAWQLDHRLRPTALEFQQVLTDLVNGATTLEEKERVRSDSRRGTITYAEIVA